MAKYFAHKPSWRGNKSSNATPPVLDFDRQPSGVYKFEGKENSRRSTGGRTYRMSQKQGAVGRPTKQWRSMQQMKQRLAGFTSKANIAFAVADALGRPEAFDYGWDDFMEGRLPPPFDWLNTDIPPEWLPTQTPPQGEPLPEGSFALEQSPGEWIGFAPALTGVGSHRHIVGITDAFPPPGNNPLGPTVANYKVCVGNNYGGQLWQNLAAGTPGWSSSPHDFTDSGASPTPGWLTGVTRYIAIDRGNGVFRAAYMFKEQYHIPRVIGQPAPAAPQFAPIRMTAGATEEEALNPVVPGRIVMNPLPARYPWRHPYQNLFKEIAGARVVDIPAVSPVNVGGTKVIGERDKPILKLPTKPGEPQHPPGNGTKERKRLVGGRLFFFTQKLFHGITEYEDLLDALYGAIPKQYRCKTKTIAGKSACLVKNLDKVDIGDAIVNVAWNQFEDYVLGRGLFGLNKKAAHARGDRYGFRTLNSANDYGGLDSLGEAYGDFSKEYINPTKQDLKNFLTERFGI